MTGPRAASDGSDRSHGSDGSRPGFTAHRGESYDAPENTLAAFRLAWERGIKTVELDVRLSADGQLVICHDADTFRTTGVRLAVAETRCADLRLLDAGSRKGPEWAGERIPTLEEALRELPIDCAYWIEIKSGPPTAGPLADALRRMGVGPDRAEIISFDDDALRAFTKMSPAHRTQLISGFRRADDSGTWEPTIEDLIARARRIGADAIAVHYEGPLTAEACERVHDAGLALCVWTVDDLEPAVRLASLGVDAITSNRAAWLRDAMQTTMGPREPREIQP